VQDTGLWLLKSKAHYGHGLQLVTTSEAYATAVAARPRGKLPWALAQQYIANPLLLEGRKFGVRLHVLVPPGLDPFRVYAHKAGYVDLSAVKYDAGRWLRLAVPTCRSSRAWR
jgi:hypothetical protein